MRQTLPVQLKPDEQSACVEHTSPSVPSTGSGCFAGGLAGVAGGLAGRATGFAVAGGVVGLAVPGAGYVAGGVPGAGYVG